MTPRARARREGLPIQLARRLPLSCAARSVSPSVAASPPLRGLILFMDFLNCFEISERTLETQMVLFYNTDMNGTALRVCAR